MLFNFHTHSTDKKSGERAIINTDPMQYKEGSGDWVSLSIHPWYLENVEGKLHQLELLATKPNVVAIGECGLDVNSEFDMEIQKEYFRRCIAIAKRNLLPVILHGVKTHDMILKMLREEKFNLSFIFHGFNQKQQIAKAIISSNGYISFGKALMMNDSNASKIIQTIPRKRILLETDDKKIAIENIYHCAAKLLGIGISELENIIAINIKEVIGNEGFIMA